MCFDLSLSSTEKFASVFDSGGPSSEGHLFGVLARPFKAFQGPSRPFKALQGLSRPHEALRGHPTQRPRAQRQNLCHRGPSAAPPEKTIYQADLLNWGDGKDHGV